MIRPLVASLISFSFACVATGCTDEPTSGGRPDASAAPDKDAAVSHGDGDSGAGQSGGPILTIANGKLEGEVEGGVRHFFGIPYAQPPLGSRRFRAPVKNEPWSGIRKATTLPGRCAQPTSLNTGEGTDNEDCLYLNVWTPEPAPSPRLPVLVWIHGGGNQNGATSDPVPGFPERLFYDGHSFAEDHGVVMVSLNYRLGVLGYLSHPELRDEGSPSGNQGLLDQQMALEWVRDNISAFGGDPQNVTLFGESAGARNVCFHVVSPRSRGLFHRAISESGDCTGSSRTRAQAEAEGDVFAAAVGCSDPGGILACLRTRPAGELIDAKEPGDAPAPVPGGPSYSGRTPLWDFRPTADGDVIPRLPRELFEAGEIAHVPYIVGTNDEEGGLAHLTAPLAQTEAEYKSALERRFGTFGARVAAMYPVSGFETPNAALIRVTTDERYACAVQDFAERAARAGLEVHAYNFEMPYAIPGLAPLGAAHAAELTYVFDSLREDQPPGAAAVSDLMQGYWSRFAKTGNPNGGTAPTWPAFDPDRGTRLAINAEPSPIENFRSAECAMWKEYYATSQ
jgi:para-nitrobenzyl esterase